MLLGAACALLAGSALAQSTTVRENADGSTTTTTKETVVEHGPLKLEAERMRVTWNGSEVPLTVTEFWMVHTLVRFPGHVKNRDQLMREAQVVVDDATITSHIKRIRKKFIAIDAAFDSIETVHGVGYRWTT